MERRVLVVDDDSDFATLLSKFLKSKGVTVEIAGTAEQAKRLLEKSEIDLVLLDIVLPDESGVKLVSVIKAVNEDIPVIMISGHGDKQVVVDAMQAGASDYIPKPIEHADLWEKITHLLEERAVRNSERLLEDEIRATPFLGTSSNARQLIRDIAIAANSEKSVILRGEPGTCPALAARLIHDLSPLRFRPFVVLDCLAYAEGNLEKELFGVSKKAGKLELAQGGTFFLDEIGELPPGFQIKLLRVLRGGEFEPVGSDRTIQIDVRLIASTHRKIEELVQSRRFREDLFLALNSETVTIPPLRERKEDLPAILEELFRYHNRRLNRSYSGLPEGLAESVSNQDWPGNYEELSAFVQRALLYATGPYLAASDFFTQTPLRPSPIGRDDDLTSLKDLEYRALIKALRQSGGNISKTAKRLGIGRDTVYRRLKKYKIGLRKVTGLE